MKKIVCITVVCLFAAAVVMGQTTAANKNAGEPNAEQIGTDTAQQKLKEVSITKFEDGGMWAGSMPKDDGLITLRRLPGSPLDKQPIPDEETAGIKESDKYVLGVRIQFFKRGYTSFAVVPSRPIPVEGITKTVSLWVVGRNNNHVLNMLISDHFGNRAEIVVGKLNFSGWKKLTIAIPTNIVQKNYHYNNKMGIKIEGFRIDCDPAEAYGSYYVYFDDLRATTDLFAEENRDTDDMNDTW